MFKKCWTEQHHATCPKNEMSVFIQGFEGTLVWENLDSAGLSTVNSSSVQLSDGGGVLKISSVRTDVVSKINAQRNDVWNVRIVEEAKNVAISFYLQIAEGILPHRSALGFPGLAGGFTFTIYGWSSNRVNSELFIKTVRSESLHEPTLQGVPVPM